jgi:uncharacterized OB-fold protein
MPNYRGVNVVIDEDSEGYWAAAREHRLVMKRCTDCQLMRWYPGPGCPFCSSLEWDWQEVSGKGTIHSYMVVVLAIQAGFRDYAPYPIVLVELDEQRNVPSEHIALRLAFNLVDENFAPVPESEVAIGKRVQIVFQDVEDDFALPQARLTDEPPEGQLWQFSAPPVR